MSDERCSQCRYRRISGASRSGLCRVCRDNGYRAAKMARFRRPEYEWSPPPSVDPTREDRIRLYEERAAANRPLFDGSTWRTLED